MTPPFVFFGTSHFSVLILEELFKAHYIPALIVTQPDMPKGRGLVLTPPPAKVWALEKQIPVFQSAKLDAVAVQTLSQYSDALFIVASYGIIIPQTVLTIPKYKTINVHPSLLPQYRGATPLQSTILDDNPETGVSIIELDTDMDHGPILIQEKVTITPWPIAVDLLEEKLALVGANLLITILPKWVAGEIQAIEQEHSKATFTSLIKKADGLLTSTDTPRMKYLKYLAYSGWPGTYFFVSENEKEIRMKITAAHFENNQFIIDKVIPEGKKEITWRSNLA